MQNKRTESVGNSDPELFSAETEGLPEASTPEVVRLRDADEFDLQIFPVRKRVGDTELRMLAYNGSIPGPTLNVDQGSEVTVHVKTMVTSRRRCTGTA
jgi:FtsP/CotA-like multicopper oxidase with cupredoxin domain